MRDRRARIGLTALVLTLPPLIAAATPDHGAGLWTTAAAIFAAEIALIGGALHARTARRRLLAERALVRAVVPAPAALRRRALGVRRAA